MQTTIRSLVGLLALTSSLLRAAEPAQILIVVGPSTHPPGTHEVAAGGRLLHHPLLKLGAAPERGRVSPPAPPLPGPPPSALPAPRATVRSNPRSA